MKTIFKSFIAQVVCAALAASAGYAADLVVDSDMTTSGTFDNILFTADGATLTANGGIRSNYNLTVSSGVSATATSSGNVAYYLGDAVTAHNASISGAGSSSSSLLFTGYILGTYWNGSATVGNLSVSGITISMQRNASYGNNLLRGETVSLTNSVLNILAASSYSNISTYAATGVADFSLTNSTLNVESGSTLTFSTVTGCQSYKKITDSTIIVDGTVTGLSNMQFSGTNIISGSGSVSLAFNSGVLGGVTGMFLSNSSALYVTAPSVANTSATVNTTNSTLYIGVNSLGVENAVSFTTAGVQFNSGSTILKGASTITSTANFNLAGYGSSAMQSYLGTGSTVTVSGSSRINKAYIDGTINVTGGAQTANGWNYSLAFGTYSTSGNNQIGDVAIGANAQINDNASAATYFGIYGAVTSNAGAAKIKSNANAPLMLYKDTTLTLNSTDAFAVGGAATQAEATFNLYAGANVSLAVNADNNIGVINFRDGSVTLALSIAEGKNLTLGSFTNTVVGGLMAIALDDTLQYGEFKVTDMSYTLANYASQSSLNFTDGSGSSRVLGTNLFITETSTGSGEYYIYTVAVPEPAEWAAIFGAIAIGLAIYRKRNSGK